MAKLHCKVFAISLGIHLKSCEKKIILSALEFRNNLTTSSYQLDKSTNLGSYLEIELLESTEEIVVLMEANASRLTCAS